MKDPLRERSTARAEYRTVRVFISSTFRDMQAERDHLVRFVFPKLREELLARRIHLVEVDLRWGVTTDQDVSEVCREIVAECRPRFLCMLGGRYGDVPDGKARSLTAEEVHYAVLDRGAEDRGFAFFYFRDPDATASIDETYPGELREPSGSAGQTALENLKSAIRSTGLQPFVYPAQWDSKARRFIGLKALGDRVHADLKRSIDEEYHEQEAAPIDEFAEESSAMEAFIAERTERFLLGSREWVLDELASHAESTGGNGCLCLLGEPGSGKSSLLARFAATWGAPGAVLISHFAGASTGSTDVRRALRRLSHEIVAGTGIAFEIPGDPEELRESFPGLLKQACERNRVVILLDAVDKLNPTPQLAGLGWLPEDLPDNARLIVSTLPGPALEELRRRHQPPREVTLPALTAEDGQAIIQKFLDRYRKTMTDDQRTALLAKPGAGTPLYLLAALEELRTLGTREEVSGLIARLPPVTQELFLWILERLEKDEGFRDASGRKIGQELVPRFASLMAMSRVGLSQRELVEILAPGKPEAGADGPDDPQGNVAALLQLLRPYLMRRGELLDFYHGELQLAVEKAYLQTDDQHRAAHGQLADYFRAKADPNGDQQWEQDARLLGELPFHLAQCGREAERQALFTQLAFLAARVATGQIYEQLTDFASTGPARPSVLGKWHEFLQKHAQRLFERPAMLVALVHHEGFAEARAQVASVSWREPWLRTSPEPMPKREAQVRGGLRLELTGSLEFHRSCVAAFAPRRAVGFCLERLGSLRVFDARAPQKTEILLSIRRERPLVVACAPDAGSLMVFYESGWCELYRCIPGRDEGPARLELATGLRFHLPEYEDPVVAWHDGAYWFQTRAGALGCLSAQDALVAEEPLPGGQDGELSALVFGEGYRLVAIQQGFDASLLVSGAQPLRRPGACVLSACACGERKLAVAFSDGTIVVYEAGEALIPRSEVRVGMLRGEMGWDGSRLLWLAESGKLEAWRPEDAAPLPVQENEEALPLHLHVIPRRWHSWSDGTVSLLTTHSFVVFRLSEGGSATDGRLEELFGGPVWRAVWKGDEDQWLLESDPLREVLLGRDTRGRLYCAPDGRGHFFSAHGNGQGFMFDLATFRPRPIRGCPLGLNLAVGEPEGGCWLVDRAGDVYFVDTEGNCRCVERIGLTDVHGAQLQGCGDFLLWAGYSSKPFETGAEAARTFIAFRKHLGARPRLERLGERFRHPREGMCLSISHDEANHRLVALWVNEADQRGGYRLQLGTPEEIIDWRFVEKEVAGLGRSMFVRAALSADARFLGVLKRGGELSVLSVADGRVVATLEGSAPFTQIAPGASGPAFWLVESRARVYACSLVRNR